MRRRPLPVGLAVALAVALAGCGVLPGADVTTAAPSVAEPLPWKTVEADAAASVVQVRATSCAGPPVTGSGFVVGDDLVVASAAMVADARVITVKLSDGEFLAGYLVATDADADVALLRTDLLTVPRLALAEDVPGDTTKVRAVGFPRTGASARAVAGSVAPAADGRLSVDAKLPRGFAGAPVVAKDGRAVGVLTGDADASATDASVLAERIAAWRGLPTPDVSPCKGEKPDPPREAQPSFTLSYATKDRDARVFGSLLTAHALTLGRGSPASAWGMFTPGLHTRLGSFEAWSAGPLANTWRSVEVKEFTPSDAGAQVQARVKTTQPAERGYDGQTCSLLDVTFRFQTAGGEWLIDRAIRPGSPAPCA